MRVQPVERIDMCTNPFFLSSMPGIPLPCGKCLECCMAHSRMWIGRIMDEASLHDKNCCITLTYEQTDGNLSKRDFQLFMKRLRKALSPIKIRFYCSGEYGGKGNRPHYHCIIFGWYPDDLQYYFSKKGVDFYKSKFVSDIWSRGYILVSPCSYKAVKYCAKYLTKLDKRIHDVPPFTLMSRSPGIGADSIKTEYAVTGQIFRDGKCYQIPRYYIDKLEKAGYNVDMIKARRRFIAQSRSDEYLDPAKLAYQRHVGNEKLKRLRGG
ncbi:replication initiator protein [Microvirus mar16]|uniref:Replication initiator protein n=1 Tax=Microvirus mar16 TaxID=2851148 RepID=A0A8F5XVF2_9VIRU|nr:replication initiator protein [Microvirus mar16]